jgi:hypothetical protein
LSASAQRASHTPSIPPCSQNGLFLDSAEPNSDATWEPSYQPFVSIEPNLGDDTHLCQYSSSSDLNGFYDFESAIAQNRTNTDNPEGRLLVAPGQDISNNSGVVQDVALLRFGSELSHDQASQAETPFTSRGRKGHSRPSIPHTGLYEQQVAVDQVKSLHMVSQ